MNTEFVPAQTSVPDWMMTYCRQLADVHYERKLNRMYVHVLESFLDNEPWKAQPPFDWREARIHRSKGQPVRTNADPGWVPMNMLIPTELYNRISTAIEIAEVNAYAANLKRGLSMRTFLFTAISWWVMYVYPYEGPGVIPS